jgi:hypothetical protein
MTMTTPDATLPETCGHEFSFGRERSLTLEQLEALAKVVKGWGD